MWVRDARKQKRIFLQNFFYTTIGWWIFMHFYAVPLCEKIDNPRGLAREWQNNHLLQPLLFTMSCTKSYSFGTKNSAGESPYEFNFAVFVNSIICVMTNKEKQTQLCAIYDCNTLPTDKNGNTISYNQVKTTLCSCVSGSVGKITFINESQVSVVYDYLGITINFIVKLQPFVMRTDAIILAEVEQYLETMDKTIADTFHWKNMRLDLFGHYLTETWRDFGFDKVMEGIRGTIAKECNERSNPSLVGVPFDALMNHPKFNTIYARIVAIETFYRNFEQNMHEQRALFEEQLYLDVSSCVHCKKLSGKANVRDFIAERICRFVDEDLPNNLPIPVFAKGVIVNFKKMQVYTDADEGMTERSNPATVGGIFEPCIDAMMETEFANLFPIYTIDAGKYAKMVFGEEGVVDCFTESERDIMLGKFAEVNPLLSVDVMKSAFGERSSPSSVGYGESGVMIVKSNGDDDNEVQQHLISILDEELARMN